MNRWSRISGVAYGAFGVLILLGAFCSDVLGIPMREFMGGQVAALLEFSPALAKESVAKLGWPGLLVLFALLVSVPVLAHHSGARNGSASAIPYRNVLEKRANAILSYTEAASRTAGLQLVSCDHRYVVSGEGDCTCKWTRHYLSSDEPIRFVTFEIEADAEAQEVEFAESLGIDVAARRSNGSVWQPVACHVAPGIDRPRKKRVLVLLEPECPHGEVLEVKIAFAWPRLVPHLLDGKLVPWWFQFPVAIQVLRVQLELDTALGQFGLEQSGHGTIPFTQDRTARRWIARYEASGLVANQRVNLNLSRQSSDN